MSRSYYKHKRIVPKRNIALVHIDGIVRPSPLALGDIAAYALADKDVCSLAGIKIFHLPRNFSYEKVIQSILQIDPVMVGFSAYSWNFYALKIIAQMIKQSRKETLILFGGPNVSGQKTKESLRDYTFIDFIIEGEGEVAFLQLLKTVLNDSDNQDSYKEVQNLTFRYDGKPIRNPTGPKISNLDDIPSSYLTNIFKPTPRRPVVWETNRGCPHQCSYCYWGNNCQTQLSRYSMERIEEELMFFVRQNVNFCLVADANFGLFPRDKEIAEMLCRINNEHGRPLKIFHVNWAKTTVTRTIEIAETFAKNEVESSLTIAYQTLTPEAQELCNRKSISLERGSQLLQLATEKNISVYTDLILGLPGESYSEFLIGLDKICDLGIQYIVIFPLELIPGSRFYEEKEKFGFKTLATIEQSEQLVLSHPKLSAKDHQKGVIIIHAHHLFHTLKTCHFINRYLKLIYGVRHSKLCESFLHYVEEDHKGAISAEAQILCQKLFEIFTIAGESHGVNIDKSINLVAYTFWDHWKASEELFLDFYRKILSTYPDGSSPEQWVKIQELLRFNLFIAPKPGWSSKKVYSFTYDVGRFYQETMRHWIFAKSTSKLPKLEKRTCLYRFTNSWGIRPSITNTAWTRNITKRMCRFEEVNRVEGGDENL